MYKFEEIQHRSYKHLVSQLNALHDSGFDVIQVMRTIPLENNIIGIGDSVSFVLLKKRDEPMATETNEQ
jgi:hypothetical protein